MESHQLRRILEAHHALHLDLLALQLQSEQCQVLEVQHDLLGIEQDQIAQIRMSEALADRQQAESELQQALGRLSASQPPPKNRNELP